MIRQSLCAAAALAGLSVVGAGDPASAEQMVSGIGHTLCLTVTNNRLQLNHCGLGDAQNWFSAAYGQQHYHNLCLDSETPNQGATLVVAACANKPSQRWALQSTGRFNNESGWCADVADGRTNEGNRAIIYKCGGALNQVWTRGTPAPVSSLPPAQAKAAVIAPAGAVIDMSGKIISQDGNGLVAQGGGNIVAQGGGNIVAQGGGNVIKLDGGALVAQGGGNLHN